MTVGRVGVGRVGPWSRAITTRVLVALATATIVARSSAGTGESELLARGAGAGIVIRGTTAIPGPGREILPEDGLIRWRLAEFDISAWQATLEAAPTDVAHEFFEGETLETPTFTTEVRDDLFAWQSQLDAGWVHLWFEDARVLGTVNLIDHHYSIITRDDGLVQILEYGERSPSTTDPDAELPRTG